MSICKVYCHTNRQIGERERALETHDEDFFFVRLSPQRRAKHAQTNRVSSSRLLCGECYAQQANKIFLRARTRRVPLKNGDICFLSWKVVI